MTCIQMRYVESQIFQPLFFRSGYITELIVDLPKSKISLKSCFGVHKKPERIHLSSA